MEFDRIEALRIGQELKKIRKQKGLSLADVESLSGGRWKAVVIGSYERADRAISIGRLSALMALYQTPVSALFAHQSSNRPEEDSQGIGEQGVKSTTFDLSKRLDIAKTHHALDQFLTQVINLRGDWNGHIISIRASDLRLLAMFEGKATAELLSSFFSKKFLVQWR